MLRPFASTLLRRRLTANYNTNRPADESVGCRLSPVPLTPENWKTPVNPDLIDWTEEGVTLALERKAGPRMHTHDGHTYGMYSLKVKADPSPGAVTAFYVGGPGWGRGGCAHMLLLGWLWPAAGVLRARPGPGGGGGGGGGGRGGGGAGAAGCMR